MRVLFLGSLVLWSQVAGARVFDLKRERFGSYLMGGMTVSNLKDSPIVGESAADEFTEEYKSPVGGEFGFMYANPYSGFRFGFEILKPLPAEGDARVSSSKVYHYVNTITVLVPKLGLDINLLTGSFYRLLVNGFFGAANLQTKTDYSQVSISPATTHSVETKSAASMYGFALAGEIAVFDTTTFMLEAGYRQLKFTSVKYAKDITTFNGTYASGEAVVKRDGTNREIDFTGFYMQAGFRFFIY